MRSAGLGILVAGVLGSLLLPSVRAGSPQTGRLTRSGDPIAATLDAEQTHSYRIALEPGQFLHVIVDQLGADVVVHTKDPAGRPLLEFDSPGSGEAPEPVFLLAEQSGDHTIDVRAYLGSGGDYAIRVETLRPHEPIDRTRMAAERAFIDGRVLRRNGDPESVRRALVEFDKALAGFGRLGDDFRRADTLVYMGGLYQLQRESRKALDAYHVAIELFGRFGQRRRQGITWINVGWCHDNLGDYPAALAAYSDALAIHQELGNEAGIATTLGSLGLVHQALGDSQGALELHERAYERWESMGYGRGEGVALRDLGLAYERAGFTPRAEERYRQALARFEEHGPRRREAQTLIDLSRVEHAHGNLAGSMRHAERGLALYRELEDRRGEARALLDLGRRQHAQGEADAARDSFTRSVAVAREIDDRYTTAWAQHALALVLRELGEDATALEQLRPALEIVENVRGRLADDSLRSLQLASTQPLYELGVDLNLALGDDESAFATSENGRARALVEAMARAGRDVFGLAAPDVTALREALGDDAALVAYRFVGRDLVAFVVTSEDLIAHRTDLSREDAADRVAALVDLVAKDDDGSWRPVARRLADALIAPWIEALDADVSRLWIVPDGALFDLPFELLPVSEDTGFLLERFAVSYLPAAALVGIQRDRERSEHRVLVYAAPPGAGDVSEDRDPATDILYRKEGFDLGVLPFSGKEARSIKARGGGAVDLRIGDAATETRFKSESLGAYSVLHFATHGLVSRSPELSALLLARSADEDGFLQSREIFDLELSCELVVLSACRTARGKVLRGEGVQGLSRAFFYAGTRSVLASLWDVRDDSTARLMDRFYAHLAEGLSKSGALRRAKLDLLARPATAGPKHWAAFVLIGEPDGTIGLVPSVEWPAWAGIAAPAGAAVLLGVGLLVWRRRSAPRA